MIADGKYILRSNTVPVTPRKQAARAASAGEQSSEYIDTGDWFVGATAAIRYSGEGMLEYPEGCYLALKCLDDFHLVVWGQDYVIETAEFCIVRRVQKGPTEDTITAYASDMSTYPDGRMVYEPMDIAVKDIRNIYAILGYVVNINGAPMRISPPPLPLHTA